MNIKNSITDIKTEILVKQNWNWNTCIIEIEIETEIHCKTIIETELKCIANNGIEIETEIHLITDTTLHHQIIIIIMSSTLVCFEMKTSGAFPQWNLDILQKWSDMKYAGRGWKESIAGWKPRRHCAGGSLAEETFYIKRSWVDLGKPIMNLRNEYAEGESSKRRVQQMIKICSPFLIGHNHDEKNLDEARIWENLQQRNFCKKICNLY